MRRLIFLLQRPMLNRSYKLQFNFWPKLRVFAVLIKDKIKVFKTKVIFLLWFLEFLLRCRISCILCSAKKGHGHSQSSYVHGIISKNFSDNVLFLYFDDQSAVEKVYHEIARDRSFIRSSTIYNLPFVFDWLYFYDFTHDWLFLPSKSGFPALIFNLVPMSLLSSTHRSILAQGVHQSLKE